MTPEGEVIWEFLNPYRGEISKLNGDPADHPAFKGKEMKPLDPQPDVYTLPPKDKEGVKP